MSHLTESLAVLGFVTVFLLTTQAIAPYTRELEQRWIGFVERWRERIRDEELYLPPGWRSDGSDGAREQLIAQREDDGLWLRREDFGGSWSMWGRTSERPRHLSAIPKPQGPTRDP